jgi:hypothetical protein
VWKNRAWLFEAVRKKHGGVGCFFFEIWCFYLSHSVAYTPDRLHVLLL